MNTADVPFSMERFFGAEGIPALWVTFRAKLKPGTLPESFLNTQKPLSLVFGFKRESTLSIYDATAAAWIDFSPNVTASEWNDYAIHLDYTQKEAMLLINGVLITHGFPFLSPSSRNFTHFQLMQEMLQENAEASDEAMELDSVTLGSLEPTGLDFSGDGMTNQEKRDLGLDPWLNDFSGDGLPDVWKIAHGFDPLVVDDSGQDLEGDGLTLAVEAAFNLDPYISDDRSLGFVLHETWKPILGNEIFRLTDSNKFPTTPFSRQLITELDIPINQATGWWMDSWRMDTRCI